MILSGPVVIKYDQVCSVAKDDALAWPQVVHREYPPTVTARMPSIKKFIENSESVLRTLLGIMSEYLGLPTSALEGRHIFENRSGSECRVIRNPPRQLTGDKVAFGAHTDVGSLVSLFFIISITNNFLILKIIIYSTVFSPS